MLLGLGQSAEESRRAEYSGESQASNDHKGDNMNDTDYCINCGSPDAYDGLICEDCRDEEAA